jgi:2',3'-cyclic-nucleotide 2'-phosphodiesterase (5'-nucleotidase family)
MDLRVIQYADLESTYDDPERIARFSGAIASLRDENTILVGSGDNIAPGGLALVTDGQQALTFFSAIEPDVDTLGNHDFDYGLETLLSVIRESPQSWVCANAYAEGERFGQSAGVVPWTIIERAGHRLGLFGLANPTTAAKSPGTQSLSFTDPIAAATDIVERLREETVDHILCVSHLGEEEGHGLGEVDDLAQAVDIDVICDGHTHGQPRIDRVAGTLLVRTSGEGTDLNELRFDGEWTATRHQVADASRDLAIERRFHELRASTGLDEVVATVDEPINRSEKSRFYGESRLGNFVTNAYRWVTDAEIGLQHSAGMRGGPNLYGDVMIADLISVVPFDMEVVRTDIAGEVLLDILASGGEVVYPSKPEFWHIHLSGGSVTFDYAERAVEAAAVNGQMIDSSAIYRVVAPENFLRSFDICLSNDTRTFGRQYKVLAEYARERNHTETRWPDYSPRTHGGGGFRGMITIGLFS